MTRSKLPIQITVFASLSALALALAPATALAGDAEAGKAKYTANCLTCHGETGKGDGPVGQVLQPPPRDFTTADFKFDTDEDGKPGTDADLKGVISKGAGAFGGNQMMAPWGGILSDEDIDNVVVYIRTLKQ
jgi:mono/diheme cytochrome c family protein